MTSCRTTCVGERAEICGGALFPYQDPKASAPDVNSCFLPNAPLRVPIPTSTLLNAVPFNANGLDFVLSVYYLFYVIDLSRRSGTRCPCAESHEQLCCSAKYACCRWLPDICYYCWGTTAGAPGFGHFCSMVSNPFFISWLVLIQVLAEPISHNGPVIGPPVLGVTTDPNNWALCTIITAADRVDLVFSPCAKNVTHVAAHCIPVFFLQMLIVGSTLTPA